MYTPRAFGRVFGTVLTNKPTRRRHQSLLDVPTYTIPEAAAFLAIPSRTMQSWFTGRARIFEPAGRVGEYALLSFNDVSEAYVLFVLREFHGFSSSHIRRANRSKTEREIVDLSRSRNLAIGPVVDVFGKRILQDARGHAVQLFPWRFWATDNESRPVTLDPDVMSGRLVVTGTRIPVSVLAGLRSLGKQPEEIAQNYRLSTEVVKKALLHIERPVQKVA